LVEFVKVGFPYVYLQPITSDAGQAVMQ